MSPITNKQLINYWLKTAEHDYDTMLALFKSKRYSDSLFFGHIVLEKILKALVVKKTKKQAKYTHNLLILLKKAGMKNIFTKKDIKLLGIVNDFNLRTRYPDYKLKFYKKATKIYTEKYLFCIKNLYKKIWQLTKENN